jgi:peroxiredoxin
LAEPQVAAPPAVRPAARSRRFIWYVVLAVALVAAFYRRELLSRLGYAPAADARVGQAAPAFVARTLDGQTLRFPDDFRGRRVLLAFWATWCPPCRAEIPDLRAAYADFGDRGLALLGVSLDGPQGVSEADFRAFVKEYALSWPQVYADTERLAGAYGVSAIPALFLIDGDTRQIIAAGEQLSGPYLEGTLARVWRAQAAPAGSPAGPAPASGRGP